MATYDQKIRDDEQYYYDTPLHRQARIERGYNWIPLLLLPLFFVLGWVTKGVYNSPNDAINNPTSGVGGGASVVVSPLPSTRAVPVTAEPSPATNMDRDVVITASPTPSVTPTTEPTTRASVTPTPKE